jgi:hypothetical protein
MPSDLRVQAERRGMGGDSWGVAPASSPSGGPPGFQPSSQSVGYDDARAQGEALRSVGALSAPPPPGFNPGPGDKSRLASNSDLWSDQHDAANALRDEQVVSSSFTNNLAAALGSGLMESMEDATRGDLKEAMLTDNFFANPKNDMSYARQSRHAASRVLGSSPSKDAFGPSHKASEAGSLFASFDSGERGFPKKTASSGQTALFGDFSRDRPKGDPTSNLAAAFSTDAANRTAGYHPSYQPKSSLEGNGDLMKSGLHTTKDLGVTVMEPSDSYGRGAPPGNEGNYELQRDMQNLWSDRRSNAPKRSDHSVEYAPAGVVGGPDPQEEAEEELRPFIWDVRHHDPSRALAIMCTASLSASDVRSVCESYGAVESFRSDFVERGVCFVSYYDMRCAQYAAMELQPRLQTLGPSAEGVRVQFCVPLNSSSQNDDSLVVLMDVPTELNIESLASMLSSYGAVRSLKSMGGNYGGTSFVVEYHDIQDAKQAVLELEGTQQFGPNASVETGARNPSDRKRGRELLKLIGAWRHGGGGPGGPSPNRGQPGGGPSPNRGQPGPDSVRYGGQASPKGMVPRPDIPGSHPPRHDPRYERGAPQQEPQLVLGPDGRYSYVVVNHSDYPPHAGMPPQYGQHVAHSGHGHGGTTYVTHVNTAGQQYWPQPQTHHFSGSGSVVSQSSYADSHHSGHYPSGAQSLPYYRGDGASSVGSHHSQRKGAAGQSSASTGDGDNRHLVLDLDGVEHGRDSRTSLMVRNIPNKYTQQMLLSEFTEHGHGPGIIDFFYLPIDFKNRCNRGYAFINFVDYRDILPFHRRYYGKHWRTFNSDKICDITYARIQGKSAMLKRFENSALMEKDDEYKPLVFVSHGPDKGTRLPFPHPGNK